MTALARVHGQGVLALSEIARLESLPVSYLEQLIGELRRAHIVEGTRGMHGGYRLARHPDQITVGEVYRVLEGEVSPVECTADGYLAGSCDRESNCLSKSVWTRVRDSVMAVLDSTTLGDLCRDETVDAGPTFIPLESIAGVRLPAGKA
jgi:Rrf2 family protein